MVTLAPQRNSTEQDQAFALNQHQGELLDASERYLRGKMPAATFDALTNQRVADYRSAIYALAKTEYEGVVSRTLRAVVRMALNIARTSLAK